jgi:hypothetical protein
MERWEEEVHRTCAHCVVDLVRARRAAPGLDDAPEAVAWYQRDVRYEVGFCTDCNAFVEPDDGACCDWE